MSCKKCKQEEDKCSCQSLTNTCSPIDTSCVIYNLDGTPSDLNCIEPIAPNTSLKDILEKWDQYFCNISNVTIIDCVKEKLNINVDTVTLSPSQLLYNIQEWICTYQDVNVKVTPADSTSGYLYNKIATGECLLKTVVIDPDTNEQELKISIDWACLIAKIPTCFEVQPQECIVIDNTSACVPQPLVPVIVKNDLNLTGTNCNGSLQWYNSNNVLINTGTTIVAEGNQSYYARCVTTCGESNISNIIAIPPTAIFTKTRSAVFTKECGVNECGTPCNGTIVTFTRTYTSTISQENVNSIAENDQSFVIAGQEKANLEGSCSCPECNCTFPTYNPQIVVTNATCNNSAVVANGQILIAGISNADKFGFYVGQGSYNGVPYSSAFTLNNFNQGNVQTSPSTIRLKLLSTETRIVFRIFNGANNCYTDVEVNHTPPDCTKENITVEDITVSCEVDSMDCMNYNIIAGGSGATIWYTDCTTNQTVFNSVGANQTVQRCSKTYPAVTGGVVSENGTC